MRFKRHISFAISAGLLLASAAGAADVPGSLAIWKYSGADFRSVQFLNLYPMKGGGWARSASVFVDSEGRYLYSPYSSIYGGAHPTQGIERKATNPVIEEIRAHDGEAKRKHCELLVLNQAYPLRQMIERKVLEEGLSEELLESSLKFDPDQVTFIESTAVLPEPVVRRKFGKIPENSRGARNPVEDHEGMTETQWELYVGSYAYDGPERSAEEELRESRRFEHARHRDERQRNRKYYEVKMASLWLISGQTPKGVKSLPFQGHSTQVLERVLDRNEFPYAWEIGRVAQTESGHFQKVLEASLLQIQSEAALLGIDLDKAYVFGHALDRQHARLYASGFGMKKFSGYVGDAEGQVLYTSVGDLIRHMKVNLRLEGRKISRSGLKARLKEIESVGFSSHDGFLRFRDFSRMNSGSKTGWISPAISDHETIAYVKGARSREYDSFFGREMRYDNLEGRMIRYYADRDIHSGGTGFHDPLAGKYFVRARFEDLNAFVVDVPASEAGRELEALFTVDAIIQKKLGGASEGGPENIAMTVRGRSSSGWAGVLSGLDAKTEEVYFDPVIQHNVSSSFFGHSYTTGGDAMSIIYFPYAKLRAAIASGALKIDAETLKEIRSAGPSLEEKYWAQPLPGT